MLASTHGPRASRKARGGYQEQPGISCTVFLAVSKGKQLFLRADRTATNQLKRLAKFAFARGPFAARKARRAAGIAEIPRVMQLAFIRQIANRTILEKHALVVIGFLITGLLNEGIFAVCRMRIALGFQLPDR